MFRKTDIRKIRIAVKKKDYEKLVIEFGGLGLIHLADVNIDTLSGKTGYDETARERNVEKNLSLLESYIAEFNIEPNWEGVIDDNSRTLVEREIDGDEQYLLSIKAKQEEFGNKVMEITGMIKEETDNLYELETIKSFDINAALKNMKLCSRVFGTVTDDPDMQQGRNFFIRQYKNYVLGISLSEDMNKMIQFLNGYGFSDKSGLISSEVNPGDSIAETQKKINSLKDQKRSIENEYNSLRTQWIKKIKDLFEIYSLLRSVILARKKFLTTEDIVFIDGWMIYKNCGRMVSILKKYYGDNFFLTISSRSDMKDLYNEAPIVLKNSRIFRPFELLIKNFGLPGNRELDPTPIASIMFILMFGVMFGDVGQGFLLAIAGIVMRFFAASKNLKESFISYGGSILIACGMSASIFGLLYGSIFSHEHLIPAVWFHPMENIMQLFFATIMMGVVFIALGLILNIINGVRIGLYEESLLGTKGGAGFVLYVGVVYMLVRYIQFDIFPRILELIMFVLIPLSIIFFRTFIAVLFFGKKKLFPHGALEYFIESAVEIIEMGSSFLGNTISFIRAGAFALSHAGLSIAIYSLAGIINPDLSGIGAIAVIAVGNIFIILLEGLVCSIQTLRLEYYEFFSKFFHGDGIPFTPFVFYKNLHLKR